MLSDNKSPVKQYDVIVVGAGIGGLTSALILAKEGKKVAIFERDTDICPLIRPYKRKGCEVSPGLHISGWMDDGEAISSFLKYLNVSDGVEKEINENGYGDIIIGSKEFHIPRGFDNVERALLSYFPDCAEAVHNYVRLVREVNEQSFYFNHSLTPGVAGDNSGFKDTANYTLRDCLVRYHASQEMIDMLGSLSFILIGSRAEEVPFVIHAFVLGGFYKTPGFFTINGIKNLFANYKREFARFGVELFVNSEIEEILVGENKEVTGVRTGSGEIYSSSTVVASINPKLFKEKIDQNAFRPVFKRRLDEAENTIGMYVSFYKIENAKDIQFENFVCHDKELDVVVGTTKNHSGENNEQFIFAVFMADEDRPAPVNDEAKKILADAKLKLMEKVLYKRLPNLKDKTVLLDYLKPWSFERYTKTINGSAYGIKQTLNSMGFQHKVPIRGLYLVGQAIYPGFLGAMISAFSLAFELFGTPEYWEKVRNK